MTEDTQPNQKRGRLVCIGTGICHVEQISMAARTYLQRADVVFGVMPNSLADNWIQQNNPNYVNMQKYYGGGKSRHQTYFEMAGAMLCEVRAGKDVCCALYGHPGVMANIAHLAIGLARKEGMQPKWSREYRLKTAFSPIWVWIPVTTVAPVMKRRSCYFLNIQLIRGAVLILWQISLAAEYHWRIFPRLGIICRSQLIFCINGTI